MVGFVKKILIKIINIAYIILGKFVDIGKHIYIKNKRANNKNNTPTIIANNCVGGIMYHDLGLKFFSPTINLFFSDEDYLKFLNNLHYYLNCEPKQIFIDGITYPVGVLNKDNEQVIVYFMHYSSFEEAKHKWIERCKRVDFNNLYVVMETSSKTNSDSELFAKFKELSFENKRLITWSDDIVDHELINCPFYDDYFPGKILKYPKFTSIKRYLDYFDYVAFLNNG